MEYLEGMTVKHRISGKPLEIENVLSLGINIADTSMSPTRENNQSYRFS